MSRKKTGLKVVLLLIFLVLLLSLVLLREALLASHVDGAIQYFSSDASAYFELYTNLYADVELAQNPALFLVGSPILFMKLADGNILLTQLFNLMLMGFSLKRAIDCLPSARAGLMFLFGSLIFPYFVFGFLSLNKEVYAMCSAIMFGCYLIRARLLDVLLALVFAMCARYYMFVSILVLMVMVPREKPPRYKLVAAMMLIISIAAPIAKTLVPEYSSEDLLEVSGFTGVIFSKAIDSFAYVIIYPIKYLALIPQRAYSFVVGSGRETDAIEGLVSIATLWALVSSLLLLTRRQKPSLLVRQLVIAGLIAPIPMMWSEIMHWRYYSYVYFFFLFAIVINASEKSGKKTLNPGHPVHA